jgi:hypothetical protein
METPSMKNMLSAHEVWKSHRVYWVKSYRTLLRYISSDYKSILKPIVKGSGPAKRYFVEESNLNQLVKKFEDSKL